MSKIQVCVKCEERKRMTGTVRLQAVKIIQKKLIHFVICEKCEHAG